MRINSLLKEESQHRVQKEIDALNTSNYKCQTFSHPRDNVFRCNEFG